MAQVDNVKARQFVLPLSKKWLRKRSREMFGLRTRSYESGDAAALIVVRPFTVAGTMSQAADSAGVVVHNGQLLVFGGASSSSYDEVYHSVFNSNGSLSGFSLTTPLPTARNHLAAVVAGDNVYIIGGYSRGVSPYGDVWYAPILSGGGIGAWVSSSALINGVCGHAVANLGSHLAMFGGSESGGIVSGVSVARVLSTGGVDAWRSDTPLPEPRLRPGVVVHNNYVYVIGGSSAAGPSTTVYRAEIHCP